MALLQYLPLSIVVLMVVTGSITTYLACFKYNHATNMLPYISDTGTYPPESCIFAQGINTIAVLAALVIYVRYRGVQEIYNKHHIEEKYQINKWAFKLGMASCFGLTIVANFQETNIFSVHIIGALMLFGGLALYACLQTLIYIKLTPVIGQVKTTKLRMVLCLSVVIAFLTFLISALTALSKFKGDDLAKWKEEDGGYSMSRISVYAEWTCTASILLYVLLFTEEFKNITFKEISFDFCDHKTNTKISLNKSFTK